MPLWVSTAEALVTCIATQFSHSLTGTSDAELPQNQTNAKVMLPSTAVKTIVHAAPTRKFLADGLHAVSVTRHTSTGSLQQEHHLQSSSGSSTKSTKSTRSESGKRSSGNWSISKRRGDKWSSGKGGSGKGSTRPGSSGTTSSSTAQGKAPQKPWQGTSTASTGGTAHWCALYTAQHVALCWLASY